MKDIIINKFMTLMSALKLMDAIERKLLIVCDGALFIGVLSIGDIQRAIINKISLDEPVEHYMRKDFIYAKTGDSIEDIKYVMKRERIECMPIVDENGLLERVLEWDEIFSESPAADNVLNLPVVIMAGGKGERLKPLTNFFPKPLIPVSQKTIIEEIMDRFVSFSCNRFFLSVNYKAELISEYFNNLSNENYHISYIKEDTPSGTAGSLALLKGQIYTTFFVSNCDILVEADLASLVKYHKDNNNAATMVSAVKDYSIPYGILETSSNGELTEIKEKPEIVYQVNAGLYVLEPIVFDYIKENEFLNITDLMLKLKENGMTVGVFPVSEKSWKDMGNWSEYLKMINQTG